MSQHGPFNFYRITQRRGKGTLSESVKKKALQNHQICLPKVFHVWLPNLDSGLFADTRFDMRAHTRLQAGAKPEKGQNMRTGCPPLQCTQTRNSLGGPRGVWLGTRGGLPEEGLLERYVSARTRKGPSQDMYTVHYHQTAQPLTPRSGVFAYYKSSPISLKEQKISTSFFTQ